MANTGLDNVVNNYRELKVWQKGMDNATEVYRLTECFPKHEIYGLISQMRRAAVSIPSNIAEGHARKSTKEYLHHISIARGSIAELETQLLLSVRLGYLAEEDAQVVLSLCGEMGRMLRALQDTLHGRLYYPLLPNPYPLFPSSLMSHAVFFHLVAQDPFANA